MNTMTKRMDVLQATDDLRKRTLGTVTRSLDRLIYLASTRDYNTGFYYHDGLAARFPQEVVSEALANCHREAFWSLIGTPVEDLVAQMDAYMESTHTSPKDFIAAWKKLEPYRVAVPLDTNELAADFLFSNFKIALAILERRLDNPPPPPDAWPPQLPAQ
jgi:hypothetical protein